MEKTLSTRLKEERIKQNFTQQQLADLINNSGKLNKKISRNSITRYENGTRTPDIDTLYAIADILEVDTDFLLGKSDCKKYNTKIILSDLEQLIKFTESDNKILSKIVRNIIDKMYLTINSLANNEDIHSLEQIKKLYDNIWKIKLLGENDFFINEMLDLDIPEYSNIEDQFESLKQDYIKLIDDFFDSLKNNYSS